MYVPDQFKMTEPSDVLALMKANPFAALVSHDADGLTATHLHATLRVRTRIGSGLPPIPMPRQ